MRVAVRRLRVEDVAKLQALVVENFDAIEPGLTVLDARLLLGHATIDVIGVDAGGALVLGAVGATANEEMLLKAVEAYSWCLEYPEALVRLYPSCQVSEERPPRLLFVVERMPDAFHRKIKQLGFPEVDCVEFRYLEFDGTATVYFESLLRLRRPAVVVASRIVEPESPSPTASGSSPSGDKVVTMTGGAARPGVRNPRLVAPVAPEAAATPRAADRSAAVRDAAPVVTMASRQAAAPAPAWPERPRPAARPTVLREPEPLVMADPVAALELDPIVASLCEPVGEPELPVASAAQSDELAEPSARPHAVDTVPAIAPAYVTTAAAPAPERVSFKDLATALLGATTETQEALATAMATATPKPSQTPATAAAVAPVELVLESRASETVEVSKQAPSIELEVSARSADTSAVEPAKLRVEPPASKSVEPAKPAAPAVPQGFEGLKFPNDGVLTRQWMEFLSQMSGTGTK
jgi:hypothetical protein